MASAADQLVEQVKAIQRSDPLGKSGWVRYCEASGTTFRDPNKHDAAFLSQFLLQYHEGAFRVPDEKTAMEMKFSDYFKEGQRMSLSFKQCWQAYRARFANGMNDPAQAGREGLSEFLEFIGSQGLSALDLVDACIEKFPHKGKGKGKGKGQEQNAGGCPNFSFSQEGEPAMKMLRTDMADSIGFPGGTQMNQINQMNGGQVSPGFVPPPEYHAQIAQSGFSDHPPVQSGFSPPVQSGFSDRPPAQSGFSQNFQSGFSDRPSAHTGFSDFPPAQMQLQQGYQL